MGKSGSIPNTKLPQDGSSAGAPILPGLGRDPRDTSDSTPPIPAVGPATTQNMGGVNAPAGLSRRQLANSFLQTYRPIAGGMIAFDPRKAPSAVQFAFTNTMCQMKAAGLTQIV